MKIKGIVLGIGLVAMLTGCQVKESAKVYGRYVPERKDDFAWENEYAAFRMYGPALLAENPSNGVDLWLKNSPALVVDTMYGRELKDGRPYHINYDGNLDCYKVGHTAGCGGLVAVVDNRTYVAGPYSRYEIVEQSPEKFVFTLEYDSFLIADQIYKERITITAEAGKVLNKAEVVLEGPAMEGLMLAGGIFLHDTIDNLTRCPECGLIAYAEDALSDKQAARMNYEYNGSTSQGRSYIAVKVPGAEAQDILDGCALSMKHYVAGETFEYYFGACWSEWSNGKESYKTDEEWFKKVRSKE